jgi:hypothetical protein
MPVRLDTSQLAHVGSSSTPEPYETAQHSSSCALSALGQQAAWTRSHGQIGGLMGLLKAVTTENLTLLSGTKEMMEIRRAADSAGLWRGTGLGLALDEIGVVVRRGWCRAQDECILHDIGAFDPGWVATAFTLAFFYQPPWHHHDIAPGRVQHETHRNGIPKRERCPEPWYRSLNVLEGEGSRCVVAHKPKQSLNIAIRRRPVGHDRTSQADWTRPTATVPQSTYRGNNAER